MKTRTRTKTVKSKYSVARGDDKPTRPSIFDYEDLVAFLQDCFAEKQKTNPLFSLRAWARQCGISHVASLSLVIKRQRPLRASLATNLRPMLGLTPEETRYYDLLVMSINASDAKSKQIFTSLIEQAKLSQGFCDLNLDTVKIISEWYHFAILEMILIADFINDPLWIARRLGGEITPVDAYHAMERLFRCKLIVSDKDGCIKRTNETIATPNGVPIEEMRKVHKQLLDRAKDALSEQDISTRDITSYITITTKDRIAEAAKRIREFRRELGQFLSIDGGDTVYALNMQLFELLQPNTENHKQSEIASK